MTPFDYIVISAYFGLLITVGYLTSRFVTDTSDYFRGGGSMVWWLVGSSAFMVQFSAWTFTGAASSAYKNGWGVLTIYLGNAIGFTFNYFYFAARARQLRVITTIEAVRERFDKFSQQFYTWLSIPFGIFGGSVWLFGLCIFVSLAFGIPLDYAIIITGTVVIISTLLGGAWASSSNDFVQLMIMFPVTIVAAIVALNAVGGVSAFVDRMPEGHLDFSAPFANGLLLFWMLSNLVRQFINCNNLIESGRYLAVKNTEHARKAALLAAVLSYLGPIIWFIPPLASAILYPGLADRFPQLNNPEEGAYVAIALDLLPKGMMGLMLCAMLGATISCMDTGLNRNAGIFVRNFYLPVLRPGASERELMLISRLTTSVLGACMIMAALNINNLKSIGIFELVQWFGSMILFPITIPMALVMVFRHPAPWAAWTTTVLGFTSSITITMLFNTDIGSELLGRPIEGAEINYWVAGVSVFVNIIVCSSWFLLTSLWWQRLPSQRREEIESFNDRMRRPIGADEIAGKTTDYSQAHLMGRVCMVFGAFILLLTLIPNLIHGRTAFLFSGGSVTGVGILLYRSGRTARSNGRHSE